MWVARNEIVWFSVYVCRTNDRGLFLWEYLLPQKQNDVKHC